MGLSFLQLRMVGFGPRRFRASFKALALEALNSEGFGPFRRCKWVPSKCNIFLWRANLDRIPTRQALAKRNIWLESEVCAFCGEATESVDHIFTGCERYR
ncbi:putative reverse transcriptase zinc-binding domain-containing protein [Helianthus annuus]|nr:putative reverse transcriptase zinc-binding domain-containing protein [Helianthus annuus]